MSLQQKQPLKFINQIPDEILNDEKLKIATSFLPKNYNFEIYKSIHRIKMLNKQQTLVALQFPEGLLMYACLISDILQNFTQCECTILADVTYGACCVDDLTAQSLGTDLLIHYGHSCLIPIQDSCIKILYVFVEINIDLDHLKQTFLKNFTNQNQRLFLMGTVQFNTAIFQFKNDLELQGYKNLFIPQEKPRSVGEILGCTSPVLQKSENQDDNTVLFICDGRFHMESTMIANQNFKFYQYDPYSKKITIEEYDTKQMMINRYDSIQKSKIKDCKICIIFGILGRQGSTHILNRIENLLKERNIPYMTLMVSELSVEQISLLQDIDVFVQLSCPRLSIDWGLYFQKPLLNSYEFYVFLDKYQWNNEQYPMDFYSNNGGEWSSYFHKKSNNKQSIKIQYEK